MATPAIQTLITDAQQVLNLKSLSEIRATLTAVLANANVGTPLNPNLTTQQLWDEFYQIVRQTPTDIESILVNQMMKFVFSPPAPGGAGANGQVIFNDGGALAGDPQFLWNKTTNLLDVVGAARFVAAAAGPKLSIENAGGSTRFKSTDTSSFYYSAYDHNFTNTAGTVDRLVIANSGDVTVSTGNVVMATSGKGIDFSATANGSGTMTSELLNDYEEGTWTPSFQNITLGNGTVTGFYTKIGNTVSVMFRILFGSTTSVGGNVLTISGLPFSIDTMAVGYVDLLRQGISQYAGVVTRSSATVFNFRALTVSGSSVVSSTLNATAPATWGTGDEFTAQITYRAS
jgi:hypothetical protein